MSAFLLDTHAFIWLTENDQNLSLDLRHLIDQADVVYSKHCQPLGSRHQIENWQAVAATPLSNDWTDH